MLKGYKTYILVVLGLVYVVSAFVTNHINGQTAVAELWAALTAAGLRNALP